MSRQTLISCDICGDEISPFSTKERSAQIKLWSPGEYRGSGGQQIDLCMKCYGAFVRLLKQGERMGRE